MGAPKNEAAAQHPLPVGFRKWSDARNVWPRLTDEEIFAAGWNAAVKAADSAVQSKWDEYCQENKFLPSKRDAAEEIGYAIRRLEVAAESQPKSHA